MVYGPDGTEYPSWEAAIAAGVTNPSYTKPTTTSTTTSSSAANIPTYGYELARLMQQYGVSSPTPPKTTDQSLINQYFEKLNAPMYGMPSGNALFNKYLDIGLGKIAAPFGPMTNFFPGQAVAPAGYRFDPVTATNVPVTAAGGVAEAGRITTGTPNIGGNQCPPGFNFDPVTRSCVPTPITGIPADNKPISEQQPPASCPPGTVYDPVNKICIATGCPAGYERNAAGQCVAKQTVVPCGVGFERDPVSGVCVAIAPTGCPAGKKLVNGVCVEETVTPTTCPPGKKLVNGVCVEETVTPTPCPPGKKRVNGVCVDEDLTPTPCPPGQTRNAEGKCVAVQTPCPAGQRRNAAGNCEWDLTAEEQAWVQKSKSFTDDQWREAIDEWVRVNPNATKAQADLRAQQLGVPERLIPYGYTAADYIDNPAISTGYAPATVQTQFLTPGVPTGPAGADLYKMFNENISYALDPRSLGGAGITENEAQQMWDLAKTLGLSIPQITEKVNVLGNMNLTDEQVADTIRRLAPDEAEDYFKLVKYKADGGLAKLAKKYAVGGKVEADPLMGMVKKYQQGGLNTSDAMEQLTQARANLRNTLEQLSAQEEAKPPSKAEMYFRLAAAFATPTKTGDFGESLGLAAQQMAEYRGEQREAQKAAQQQRRDLAVELAKLDYETAQSAYEKSVAAQNPQSEIGKRCKDFYGVGTADYAACMQREKELSDERAAAAAQLAAERLELDKQRADVTAQAQATKAETLTAPEIALKTATETELRAANEALVLFENILKNAEIAYTKSLPDQKDRLFAELTNPNDERVIATRTMEREVRTNLLGSLKAMFGANPTDGDRVAAEATQGLDAISVEERKNAFESAFAKMQRQQQQLAERLALINKGLYRQIQEPTDGE